MKIAVIGGGNIGRVFGVMLSEHHDLKLVESKVPKTISIDNFSLYNLTGDFGSKSQLVQVVDKIENLDNDLDVVFVCTKLFDGINVLKKVREKIKPTGAIVTIQNMFWIDRVSAIIKPENAVFMVLDFCTVTKDNITYIKNTEGIRLGIINKDAYPKLTMVTEILEKICHVEQISDIMGFTLGRNILNIAISLLGGATGLNLGQILSDKILRKIFIEIIFEGMQLFSSFNVKILPYHEKLDYYMFMQKTFKGILYRHRIIKILKKNNSRVCSSILYNLERNRKNCEVLTVVKSFISHAQLKKIKIPHISTLYQIIIDIKDGKRRINKNIYKEIIK